MVEWLSGLPEDARKMILDLLYDDNCHFARYVMKLGKNISDNDVTRFLSTIRKSVDKFHFGNHVDPWCIDNCNPYDIKDLDGVNTEVCEHMFNHINKHRNCKAMNQANFFMFWIYILDLHNLKIDGLDACEPDPRSEYRWSLVKVEEVDLTKVKKMDVDDIALGMNKMTVKEDLPFKCALCGATYKVNHTLEQHLQEKHGEEKKLFKCSECDQILKTKRNLENHVVTKHRTCKECKIVIESKDELDQHKKEHTTCKICRGDFKTKSKLERHMKTHQ